MFVIREYQPTDAEQLNACICEIQDFERQIDNRILEGAAIVDWYQDELLAECADKSGVIFVAEVEQRIAGYVAIFGKVKCEDKDEEPYEFAHLSDIVVLEAYRGRGIGRALMDAAEDYAIRIGARWLRISVLGDNEVALGLYLDQGFKPREILLEKTLPAGS